MSTAHWLFLCYLFLGNRPKKKKWQGYITQPTVNNTDSGLSHLKSVQWFNTSGRLLKNTLRTLSAICRCFLFGQGCFFFFLSWCPYLTSKWSHCPPPATIQVATESFCCITVFLYMLLFFSFFFNLCVPVITEWLCMELDHTFDIIVTVEQVEHYTIYLVSETEKQWKVQL